MKTVSNIAELRGLAISRGATVDIGGRVFNASGTRARLTKPQERAPVAAPPPPQVDTSEMLARAIREMGETIAGSLSPLREAQPVEAPAPPPAAPPPAPRSWKFTTERDPRTGLMKSAKATSDTGQTVVFTVSRNESHEIIGITSETQ